RWLIVSDVGKPKVSLSAYMAHLNSVLKSKDINEEDINEIERKIELLRNITVIPEKERYQVDPQSKHLDIGLNADEIEIPVDSTMIIDKDMTFDGKPEKIIIRITGETQIAPYSWSISIVDGEKTIFAYRTNTLWNDRNFYQKNYFRGAKSYIDNKRKYYFEYIPENIIRFSSFAHADYVFDRNNVNSAYRMALDQLLKRFSININEAERIAEKILEKIRNGVNYLHIPIGQGNMNPMIYIEEIGTFVVFLGN
ncbi:MAG: hypothetical protein GY863_23440, partial [bacterium]|nr:hypothetical protein [bacterium]